VPLSVKGGKATISRGRNSLLHTLLGLTRGCLKPLYNFEGLAQFKSKFVPTWWEDEYVVVSKGYFIPPRVASAVFEIAIPGGLLNILFLLLTVDRS